MAGSLSSSQIVPILADRGEYIASESTFYRILRAETLFRHRGAERPEQQRRKPRALCATAHNRLFSWDITYLPTPVKGIYFYLYLFMDIFSRKVVGWQIYDAESSELASDVMWDICAREAIKPDQVVLHSYNGNPMKGATMLATLQALCVAPSFSLPASVAIIHIQDPKIPTCVSAPGILKSARCKAMNWLICAIVTTKNTGNGR